MMKFTILKTVLTRISLLVVFLLLNILMVNSTFAQDPPLVYDVENTGASFPPPVLPSFNDLPVVQPLTDPFEWSDGSGRDTTFASWSHRRAEIGVELQNYEIGKKPPRPDTITASFSGDTLLTVIVIKNGDTLTLNSQVILPSGTGPFPAIIGMAFFAGGSGTGSLPSDIFTSRNIATIEFVHNQVTSYGNPQLTDPYYRLYPDQNLDNSGQYSAWAWGVSRIIDGLELVQADLPIDLHHIAVTGCSYAGKMALFAGAFDERVALTIAQESGGGGAPAWRVSETLGNVEKLGSTDHNWFREDMWQFVGSNVSKLPEDHHELMAMCAPRALLVTGNTDYEWLANPSCYVSARATQRVYENFGIGDRFGFYIDGAHTHCQIPTSQHPAIEAFVDKFLLGNTTVNTDITVNPYDYVDFSRWTEWWGTGDPTFPPEDTTGLKRIYFEPECESHGTDWEVFTNVDASNGGYITVQAGLNSTSAAPTGSESTISIPFTVSEDTTYYIFGRMNCPTANDDSYWLKLDNGSFAIANGLGTTGWQWVSLTNYLPSTYLTAGNHTLTIAYREDGALLDKICIENKPLVPDGMGGDALNLCAVPVELTSFSAKSTANKITLIWETATELNNYGFEIQRSNNNSDFVTVGFVEGFGTTTEQHTYSYTDNISGNFYYRLKQVDFNGAFKYSNVIEVSTLPLTFQLEQNYPNPFNPGTTIKFSIPESGFYTLKVYNTLGQEVAELINQKLTAGFYSGNFDATNLASGLYIYSLKGNSVNISKKMMLLR